MKRKILLADPLLEQYLPLYKKNFIVDTLWNNKKLKTFRIRRSCCKWII